ncbi:MAG: hypothetical protein WAO20_03945 [Acidobacteriota bacterium]|jgi:ABC-type uncharacterized transport system fused permease/ATPase subunit
MVEPRFERATTVRYILLFLLLICVLLWLERLYWKRTAQLLEARLSGRDRSELVRNLLDAWLDGRIEARLRKQQ